MPLLEIHHLDSIHDGETISEEPIDPQGVQMYKFITPKDLTCLEMGKELNDTTINAMIWLMEKYLQTNSMILSLHFMTKMFNIPENTSGALLWDEEVVSNFKFKTLEGCSKIFLPLLHRSHYTLYVVDLESMCLYFYNSLSSPPEFPEIEKLILYWSKKVDRGLSADSFQRIPLNCRVKQDLNDCGIMLVLFILQEIYSVDRSLSFSYNSEIMRKNFRKWILQGKIDQKYVEELFSKS